MLRFLGTGVMRIFNMGMIAVLIVIAAIGAWNSFVKNPYQEQGREEVRTEVRENNEKLDTRVEEVNENITRRVTTENVIITRRSQEIENEIRKQPIEPLSNVSSTRLERVWEQQRAIREAS